eukprot:4541214-Pyramimonas_sp.AAC.1
MALATKPEETGSDLRPHPSGDAGGVACPGRRRPGPGVGGSGVRRQPTDDLRCRRARRGRPWPPATR